MSGILGLLNLDGTPVEVTKLRDMASLLTGRGPDRTGTWHSGPMGLGHTLLATTPEMQFEHLPLEHKASGCVITGDVRLDNRPELLSFLGLADRAAVTGDAEIVLMAYLAWGETCVERLLGDFAFAIWDPRYHRLFCARDQIGMRQLIYHYSPARLFAFATEPRAILVLPASPYRINEVRIADYLVPELESIDKTSTFFEEVFRLPPAHTMTVTPAGMRQRRYWTIEPGPELRLGSDEAYIDAFLEVFTDAVRCRLRSVGPVGSMLSGGIDSGSVVAVASELLKTEDRGPLLTFSGVSPEGDADVETRSIYAASTMDGLEPFTVSYGMLHELLPDLAQLTWDIEEPFDGHMALVRAVYLAARTRGLKMLLDGVGGDTVLFEGRYLARLLRNGHWRTAYRLAAGQNRFWNGALPPGRELARSARVAFLPDTVFRRLRHGRRRGRIERTISCSFVGPELARRVGLEERLQILDDSYADGPLRNDRGERARAIDHPGLAVGRERYDRVASAVGIEPRDPFLDRRMTSFCLGLSDRHVFEDGWPKAILRQAMADRVPDDVRWRRGKEHLGWAFREALLDTQKKTMRPEVEANLDALRAYVDVDAARAVCQSYFEEADTICVDDAYSLMYLGTWLRCHAQRPSNGS